MYVLTLIHTQSTYILMYLYYNIHNCFTHNTEYLDTLCPSEL